MFKTYRRAAVPIAAVLEQDLQLWRYVEHVLHVPWFYVALSRTQESTTVREMIMVADLGTLVELLQRKDSSRNLESILLVSPAHMNGTASWLMEPLADVWYIAANESSQGHYRYRVAGGKCYVSESDPRLGVEPEGLDRLVLSVAAT